MATEVKDFKERSNPTVAIELNGKKYPLKRYTIAQEIKLKHLFQGDLEIWQKGLNALDGETLVKTLFTFLDPWNSQFKTWEDVAEELSGDLTEKMNMLEAISTCITAAMPEVQAAVKKRAAQGKKQALTLLRSSLTGPGSTTASQKPTDGTEKKSKTSRTTK